MAAWQRQVEQTAIAIKFNSHKSDSVWELWPPVDENSNPGVGYPFKRKNKLKDTGFKRKVW